MITAERVGSGRFTYEIAHGWDNVPAGHEWGEAAAVAVDSQDRIYVFNRGDDPMIVLDGDGNYLGSWGEEVFTRAHGLTPGPDDTLYCSDDGGHSVRQCTLEGEVLLTIGVPGRESAYQSGLPFNRCTDVALDPKTGDIYVADGYGNSRVHKYSPDGKLLFSWGAPGTDPGEFNIVHNIATDKDGYVYVADRENHRVQIFDSNGKYETQWANMHRPCAITITPEQDVFVGELGGTMNVNRNLPNIGPRITVYNTSGERLARIEGEGFAQVAGKIIAPHGICVTPKGDIYLADVARTNLRNLGQEDNTAPTLHKLVKVQ